MGDQKKTWLPPEWVKEWDWGFPKDPSLCHLLAKGNPEESGVLPQVDGRAGVGPPCNDGGRGTCCDALS